MAIPIKADHLQAELISEVDSVQSGDELWVGLRIDHEKHWHTYWRNPGDSGAETRIKWRLPDGVSVSDIQWPYPQQLPVAHLLNYGYSDEIVLPVKIRLDKAFAQTNLQLKARADWLVCKEICIPGGANFSLSLPVTQTASSLSKWHELFKQTRRMLPVKVDQWQAEFAYDVSHLYFQLKAYENVFADKDELIFFPVLKEFIDHGIKAEVEKTDYSYKLKQAISPFRSVNPSVFPTVIVAYKNKQFSGAYKINATKTDVQQFIQNQDSVAINTVMQSDTVGNLFIALLFAFLGGIILNFMPCVLPVLFIKVLGFVSHGTEFKKQQINGLFYSLGVVISFVAIACVLLFLRSSGEAIGWGFQLQSPVVVTLLALLFFILGLGFMGFLELGSGFMNLGQNLTQRDGYQGAFFTGMLATVVASPCTAPFMGSALGFALTQTPLITLSVFATLGIGMAIPLLLLSFFPTAIKLLPKPGAWMETFKQVLAFPLFATVLYLLWVVGNQTSVLSMVMVLISMLLIFFSLWCFRQLGERRTWLQLVPVSTVIISFYIIYNGLTLNTRDGGEYWEVYSKARFEQLQSEGRAVFINMTADWCITCLVNEQTSLSHQDVVDKFKEKDVVYLKGDWTRRNKEITEVLTRFGRVGVPLYVIFSTESDVKPVLLPQILTPETVINALNKL